MAGAARRARRRDGAYLAYPIDDLLRLLALESHRHRAIVIGEDLGTVPAGFRDRCRRAGIAGMDVLWFERDGDRFMPPHEWRDDAVAMTSTHDLPTVAGWWRGADIDVRASLGLVEDAAKIGERADGPAALWRAFTDAGAPSGDPPAPNETDARVDAAVGFVAQRRRRSPSCRSKTSSARPSSPTCPARSTSIRTGAAATRPPADEMLISPRP